jgi:hypothetical protein
VLISLKMSYMNIKRTMHSRARRIPQRLFVGRDVLEVTKLEKVIIAAVCPKVISFL